VKVDKKKKSNKKFGNKEKISTFATSIKADVA